MKSPAFPVILGSRWSSAATAEPAHITDSAMAIVRMKSSSETVPGWRRDWCTPSAGYFKGHKRRLKGRVERAMLRRWQVPDRGGTIGGANAARHWAGSCGAEGPKYASAFTLRRHEGDATPQVQRSAGNGQGGRRSCGRADDEAALPAQ